MRIEAGSRLLMIGDSVTDCGRAHPVGEGLFDALGKGYVAYVSGLLDLRYPERRIRITNMGTSGHTVRDLAARWTRDVLDLAPDWLSVLIGINDVWRQFDLPLQVEQHVPPEEYEATLDALAAAASPTLKGLVLMAPFYLEPNPRDAMRARMDEYGQAVRRVAERHGAIFVDTQARFDAFLAHRYPASIAWDRVHPNTTGHLLLARAFLDVVEYEWT